MHVVRFRWRMGGRLMLIAMIAHCDRTRRRGRLRASHAHRHQRERQNHQELQDGGHVYDIVWGSLRDNDWSGTLGLEPAGIGFEPEFSGEAPPTSF